MLGKIVQVAKVSNMISKLYYSTMDGYKIVTDKHIFYILISNSQNCCERWGHMTSEDDISYYKGAELLSIKLTDTALNTTLVEDVIGDFYRCNTQFVDFTTNKGTFQIVVYNSHNGSYGHKILLIKDKEILLDDNI